ncbi:jmjC domain-containing histone demethylation protein 1 [[Candida] jaroonii]|uniref:JmjC domain-containing histone demethylation protein 1 n=1 Tax=[Candida] jaroonii TaxID=467808 RepID=A0ACA9YB46_9ASCO|nr:jmjC domain-containing histone demethylation protein 1 [[Candida] jaroonii]
MSSCSICETLDNISEDSEDWIQCDICGKWFHVKCLNMKSSDVNEILSYHCKKCEHSKGASILKRRSKRAKVNIDYVALNDGDSFAIDKSIHPHVHKFHDFPVHVDRTKGVYVDIMDTLTFDYAVSTKLKRPILIPCESEIDVGMKLPCKKDSITIDYILDKVGDDQPVEVMDVLSQQGVSPGWNMKQWRDYFSTDKESRDRIRNVISLEVSSVDGMGKDFTRPQMVEELDLVDKVWNDPSDRPQVTKYCLMSVGGSFTDFHIDFGATSVYYTVLSGAKTFLMFPPTTDNLSLYTSWCLEQDQNYMWYPEYSKTLHGKATTPSDGFKVTLKPGDVFIIPSGWIHCVYTPEDSLVIGGNFLTTMNMKTQLDVYNIEKKTGVPLKFRHPQFNKVIWLASYYYLNNKQEFVKDIGYVKPEVKEESDDLPVVNHPKTIISTMIKHLEDHYQTSKTSQVAKKSIPTQLIGKDIPDYLSKLESWYNEF